MKARYLFLFLELGIISGTIGQNTIELTFTAVNNAAYVQLDSIKVMNRSQGGESSIYYPDSTLSLEITPGDTLLYIGYSIGYPIGIQEIDQKNLQFQLFQNYPNPVKDHSIISMYLPEDGKVSILVNDIQGRVTISNDWQLGKGIHSFLFSPGNSPLYFLVAQWKGINQNIRIINLEAKTGNHCRIDYTGRSNNNPSLKALLLKNRMVMMPGRT